MIHLGHGANVDDMAARYNKDPDSILDFSANINPYRIENLESYILQALSKSCQYPDIHYTQLRTHVADYLGCDKEWIIPGNGATEIMYLLMKCINGPLGIVNPTFSEYERSARLSGIETIPFYLDKKNNFKLNLEEIETKLDAFECLFICNPNNPTGNVQSIKELLDLLQKHDKLLIVDETFIEFVEKEETYSLLQYTKTYQNLIIIKAATKFFGLPGIRLGYGVTSSEELLKAMHLYKEPWTVNTFADYLTRYMFKETAYIEKTKRFFKEERKRVIEALSEIPYFTVYQTDANFVLLELKEISVVQFKERLFEKYNLLIRDASNFKGLDEHFIRIAIKTKEQNDLLISKLRDERLYS